MGINGMSSVQKEIKNLRDNLVDNVSEGVERGANATAQEARDEVQTHNTIWRGNLLSSIYTQKTDIDDGVRHRVVANTPYAAYVEYGTGIRGDGDGVYNFNAPTFDADLKSAIILWVQTRPTWFGERSVTTAIKIAKTIADKGTHPHPFIRPAWFNTEQVVKREARRELRQTV